MNGKGVRAKAQIYLRDFCRGPGRDNGRLNLGDDKDFGKRWTMLRDMQYVNWQIPLIRWETETSRAISRFLVCKMMSPFTVTEEHQKKVSFGESSS